MRQFQKIKHFINIVRKRSWSPTNYFLHKVEQSLGTCVAAVLAVLGAAPQRDVAAGACLTPLAPRRAAETNVPHLWLAVKCWTVINTFDVLLWVFGACGFLEAPTTLPLEPALALKGPGASAAEECPLLCCSFQQSQKPSLWDALGIKEAFRIVLQLLSPVSPSSGIC